MLVLDIFVCIFEIFIVYDFFRELLECRFKNKWVTVGVYSSIGMITFLANLFQNAMLNLLTVFLLYLLLVLFLYYGRILVKLLYFTLLFTILLSVELIAGFTFILMAGSLYVMPVRETVLHFAIIIFGKLFTYFLLRIAKTLAQSQILWDNGFRT